MTHVETLVWAATISMSIVLFAPIVWFFVSWKPRDAHERIDRLMTTFVFFGTGSFVVDAIGHAHCGEYIMAICSSLHAFGVLVSVFYLRNRLRTGWQQNSVTSTVNK